MTAPAGNDEFVKLNNQDERFAFLGSIVADRLGKIATEQKASKGAEAGSGTARKAPPTPEQLALMKEKAGLGELQTKIDLYIKQTTAQVERLVDTERVGADVEAIKAKIEAAKADGDTALEDRLAEERDDLTRTLTQLRKQTKEDKEKPLAMPFDEATPANSQSTSLARYYGAVALQSYFVDLLEKHKGDADVLRRVGGMSQTMEFTAGRLKKVRTVA